MCASHTNTCSRTNRSGHDKSGTLAPIPFRWELSVPSGFDALYVPRGVVVESLGGRSIATFVMLSKIQTCFCCAEDLSIMKPRRAEPKRLIGWPSRVEVETVLLGKLGWVALGLSVRGWQIPNPKPGVRDIPTARTPLPPSRQQSAARRTHYQPCGATHQSRKRLVACGP